MYANVHEQSEICWCKLKTLFKWFDKLARCRMETLTEYLLVWAEQTNWKQHTMLRISKTLGCSGFLQVWKRYNENWTGYAGQHFLHLVPMGFFFFFFFFFVFQTQVTRQLIGRSGPIWTSEIFWCSRASNSDHIWSQFERVRGLIPVQVSCNFDKGLVKHESRRFSIIRLREKFRRWRASNF